MKSPRTTRLRQNTDRIITTRMISNLIQKSDLVRIVRSGLYWQLDHCADTIAEACRASGRKKRIRIILPSLTNADLAVRAKASGQAIEVVKKRLSEWHEALAAMALELQPQHRLELRVTASPHRYHAFFSEARGFVGIAWHYRASLATTSFEIRPSSEYQKWLLGNMVEDFDKLWDESGVYELGDNKKQVARIETRMDPILEDFGRAQARVIDALRYLKINFPTIDGNGASGKQIQDAFGTDESDANEKLLQMEDAGFIKKVAEKNGGGTYGRVITRFGERILREWDRARPKLEITMSEKVRDNSRRARIKPGQGGDARKAT